MAQLSKATRFEDVPEEDIVYALQQIISQPERYSGSEVNNAAKTLAEYKLGKAAIKKDDGRALPDLSVPVPVDPERRRSYVLALTEAYPEAARSVRKRLGIDGSAP